MRPFSYLEPANLDEALELLQRYGEKAKLLAGGTDLVVQMKQGKTRPEAVIGLVRLKDLDFIHIDSAIRIGPLTPLSRIADHPFFAGRLPILREAALAVADVQIRNAATIGGNIANASPSADMPPALLALRAEVKLRKKGEERVVGLNEFCVGPFCTHLEGAEMIVEVVIPSIPEGGGAYRWLPKRTAVDETLVGVGVWLRENPEGKKCASASIALGSVAPLPIRCPETESFLLGKDMNPETFHLAGEMAAMEASPRSRADYRRTLIALLTEEALGQAWKRARS